MDFIMYIVEYEYQRQHQVIWIGCLTENCSAIKFRPSATSLHHRLVLVMHRILVQAGTVITRHTRRPDLDGNVSLVEYSPYRNGLYGVPGKGKTGSITWDVSNNIEMKIKSDEDSTGFKKISLIDELGASMSYNMAADTRPWSDLSLV